MHPLSPDLSKLNNDDLHRQHGELLKKLSLSYRWGKPEMVQQLQMIIEDFNNEIQLRNQKALEDMQKASKNFKNIIDIQ